MSWRLAWFVWWIVAASSSAAASEGPVSEVANLLAEAGKAEREGNVEKALTLYRQADQAKPDDPHILQKISKQLSDSIVDSLPAEQRLALAREALAYAERAATANPDAPACVLSIAVCYGKLALLSPNSERIDYARRVQAYAQRALELNPNYDWAHHVLGRWHCELAQIGGPKRAMARILYSAIPKGTCREGLAHLRTAVQLAPDCASHRLELGAALYACGQREEATIHLRAGLQLPSQERQDNLSKVRGRAILALLARHEDAPHERGD